MDVGLSIKSIYDKWFLSEPALHAMLCTHDVRENSDMECLMRSGAGRIEYNPVKLQHLSQSVIEQALRVEVIRIMLKHPYSRQPADCPADIVTMGSDCALTDNYTFDLALGLDTADDHQLVRGESFEWYAYRLKHERDNNGDDNSDVQHNHDNQQVDEAYGGKTRHSEDAERMVAKAQQSKMWKEDELSCSKIDEQLRRTVMWGTLPGGLVERIIASTVVKVDYRKVLQGFRQSIISQQRKLTRMRPNRRSYFEQMGSIYQYSTRLLVAVDVSGSVDENVLSDFFGVINRFFKYGISQIDVVQFDTELGDVTTLDKAKTVVSVDGRGGTSFLPVFEYVSQHREYDGLIILTDGFADHPKLSSRLSCRVLWICDTRQHYDIHVDWMKETGRVAFIG